MSAAVLKLYGISAISEATDQNWPWWGHRDHPDQPEVGPVPCMPDFATDDAASVLLAEKIAQVITADKDSIEMTITRVGDRIVYAVGWRTLPVPPGSVWGDVSGATLGAALLEALKTARGITHE